MSFYTYAHYRASDGKLFYVGKGTGTRHKSSDPRNAFWVNTVKKHGFTSEILAYWSSDQEAAAHEIFLIACFKNDLGFNLCNLTDGGDGRRGVTNTPEVRAAHSERMKDPAFNPSKRLEVRAKLTDKNNPMFGKRGVLSPHYGKPRADQREPLRCPNCGKTGMAAGMRRWHFNHCKHSAGSPQ